MCVMNKQFELYEFIYVDLLYDEFSLTFTAGYVCLRSICSYVVVLSMAVRLSSYPMWMWWL